jgi:indolepyruvate decarboxylase
MGVTVGALGIEISSGKRPLVIVGDGAFGMWSLGSLLMLRKYHSKMIVIVLNNAGWGMLRPIAENAPYLDLPSGHFEKFPEVIGEGLHRTRFRLSTSFCKRMI